MLIHEGGKHIEIGGWRETNDVRQNEEFMLTWSFQQDMYYRINLTEHVLKGQFVTENCKTIV